MLLLAPSQEAAHHTAGGAAGVEIGDPSAKELIGGKESVAAGALKDGRGPIGPDRGPERRVARRFEQEHGPRRVND